MMRVIHLCIAICACAVPLCAVATTTASTPRQQGASVSSRRPSEQAAAPGKVRPRALATTPKPKSPLPVPHKPSASTIANSGGARRQSSNAREVGTQHMQTRPLNTTRPVPSVPASQHSAPVSNIPRHHSANPAAINGSSCMRVANTGALNGTHMSRRP